MEVRMTKFEVGVTTCAVRMANYNQLRMTSDLRTQSTPAVQLSNELECFELRHSSLPDREHPVHCALGPYPNLFGHLYHITVVA